MRVLVSGSAGYIGSVLVPVLKRAGHTVLGYDAGWFGDDNASQFGVRGDIRDTLVVTDWPDVVVHLAGLSNDPMGDLTPTLTWEINNYGTQDMLVHHARARHVIVSSCAVYGQAAEVCDEEAIPNPQTVYAQCKARVDEWAMTSPLIREAIILRLGTVFGPSPNHRLDLVVNRMVFDAMNGLGVRVAGDAARPLTHIDDVAAAILWAVEGHATGIYNVVGENVRMRELGREVAKLTASPIRFEDGGEDTRDYMASGSKILGAGWAPTHSVAGSLPALVEFTTMDMWDLPHHVRLNQLKDRISRGLLNEHLRSTAA